jgi:dihydrofolate reductase
VPSSPSLTAIAAVGANGVIGDGAGMLWHVPEDFARFKRVTMGGVLIMGRRTYESLGGALKGRCSIILTRQTGWAPENTGVEEVEVVTGLENLVARLRHHSDRKWWVCGGGEIYRALWPYTTELDLTELAQPYEGSVTFPAVDETDWRLTVREQRDGFAFAAYERRQPDARAALEALLTDAV